MYKISLPGASQTVPHQQARDRFGVADGAVERPAERLLPGDDMRFEMLVVLRPADARRQSFGGVKMKTLGQATRRGVALAQLPPAGGGVAGLFGEFPDCLLYTSDAADE